jgi:hypothetical protein
LIRHPVQDLNLVPSGYKECHGVGFNSFYNKIDSRLFPRCK